MDTASQRMDSSRIPELERHGSLAHVQRCGYRDLHRCRIGGRGHDHVPPASATEHKLMHGRLFTLLGQAFPSYFVLLVTGFVIATAIGCLWAKRIGQNPDVVV